MHTFYFEVSAQTVYTRHTDPIEARAFAERLADKVAKPVTYFAPGIKARTVWPADNYSDKCGRLEIL